jgi:hypothetical protein
MEVIKHCLFLVMNVKLSHCSFSVMLQWSHNILYSCIEHNDTQQSNNEPEHCYSECWVRFLVMQSVVIQTVVYAECQVCSIIILSVFCFMPGLFDFAECWYDECCYAECVNA